MRRRGLAALAVASLWCAAAPATAAAAPSAPPSGEPPWAPGVLRRLPPGDAPFPALVRTAGPGLAAALCARPGGGGGGGAAAPTGATQQQQQQQQQPQPAPHPCAPLLRLAHHALPGGGGCSRLYASAVHGFAASLRPSGVRALHACDPALLALVEHDYPVHALAEAAAEEGAPADGGGGGGGGGADWAGASPVVSADEEGVSGSGAAAGLPTLAAPGPGSAPPWSLDRLDQRSPPLDAAFATGAAVGSGVRIYVVDSGIRGTHDEFLAPDGVTSRAVLGVDLVASPPAETAAGLPVDVDGHGTHVAGTAGGRRVGVAPGATLVSVRVLDGAGQGRVSDVVAGLDWVHAAAQLPAVATLSLGVPRGAWSSSLDAALSSLVAAGVFVVVAAGNGAGDACAVSPAGSAAAFTVGASTLDPRWRAPRSPAAEAAVSAAVSAYSGGASGGGATGEGGPAPAAVPPYESGGLDGLYTWTDTGRCVALFAPGVDILSACGGPSRCGAPSDTAYALSSGTSMAAPHVAGVAAGYLSLRPRARPAEVRAALVGNATAAGLQQPAGGGAQAGVGGPQLLAGSPRLLLYSRLGGELGAPGSTGGGLATG